MMAMEAEETRRALVIAAHPDDPDFGAGGTAALWTQDGWEFYYLVCTNGSKGSDDPEMTPEMLVRLREPEQRDAAAILGVKDVFFLGYEDGELTYTRDLLRDVVRYIRLLRPYAVFTHDPTVLYHNEGFINHTDHRCTGLVVTDAVYPTARDRLNFPEHEAEGLRPHKVKELYLWGSNQANFSVDITDVIDQKIQALLAHRSQFANREDFVEFVRMRWRNDEGRYLEQFRRIQMLR